MEISRERSFKGECTACAVDLGQQVGCHIPRSESHGGQNEWNEKNDMRSADRNSFFRPVLSKGDSYEAKEPGTESTPTTSLSALFYFFSRHILCCQTLWTKAQSCMSVWWKALFCADQHFERHCCGTSHTLVRTSGFCVVEIRATGGFWEEKRWPE